MVRPLPPRGRVGRLHALLVLSVLAALAVPSIAAAQVEVATDTSSESVATEVPTEVAPLVAAVSADVVTLTWLDAAAQTYVVQRSADAGDTFTTLATVEGTVLTFVDDGLAAGSYVYRVVADGGDPLEAPAVTVEVEPIIDPPVDLPTDPTGPDSDPSDPTPEPPDRDGAPVPDRDVDPLSPDAPGLPGGAGPAHGSVTPTLPEGQSQDPHEAKPGPVRSAGDDLRPIRTPAQLRLLPPRRLAGLASVSLVPQTAAAPPLVAAPAPAPLIPASVAAAAMPLGPVVAAPPPVVGLVPAAATSSTSAPLAVAFALLMATACGHVARRVLIRAAGGTSGGRRTASS